MNFIFFKFREFLNRLKTSFKKYRVDKRMRIMKGSQLELYKKYMLQLDKLENKHQKTVGIIFTVFLVIGLVIQCIFKEGGTDKQLYLTIIISIQLLLMVILTTANCFLKQPSYILSGLQKLLLNTMLVAPIEVILLENDQDKIIWHSYLVGILVIGISLSMKNQIIQTISIFLQSFYLMIRFSSVNDTGLAQYLIRIVEITLLSVVILFICQDQGKSFLMDYFVENTKGNTAKSVIKSSLPLPVFATKLKTANLDSSRIVLDTIDNLELDIVFANKFCRQIFNIKKKIEMKQKLKYLFLQGESNNTNNNNNNNANNEPIKVEFDKVFEGTDYYCASPEFRQKQDSGKMQEKNSTISNPTQFAKFTEVKQPYRNDFYNLHRSQVDALSPTKEGKNGSAINGINLGDKFGSNIQNGKEFHLNPISTNFKYNESQEQMERKDPTPNNLNYFNSKSLIDGFMQQNQIKKQTMTQQFLKQNFTKQEIKDYGMTGSQLTSLLYYHILEKLYSCLFNRLRSEANGKNGETNKPSFHKIPSIKHPTSINNLSPQASQIFDQQQEEVFLDVLYIDSDKKRRKFFDIKIIEVEWENENAMMVKNYF